VWEGRKKYYLMRHLYLHKYCNEGQICVAFQYAGSKPSRSHRRFNSDMMVQYTFRECLSLTIRLYITQDLNVIALTRLLAVTCLYSWRNYTCGSDKDFGIEKLQCFRSSSGSNLCKVSHVDCIRNCTFLTSPRRVEHLWLS
jgi:hypothetical protein